MKKTPVYYSESHEILTLDLYKHHLSIKLFLKSKESCQKIGYSESITINNKKNGNIERNIKKDKKPRLK